MMSESISIFTQFIMVLCSARKAYYETWYGILYDFMLCFGVKLYKIFVFFGNLASLATSYYFELNMVTQCPHHICHSYSPPHFTVDLFACCISLCSFGQNVLLLNYCIPLCQLNRYLETFVISILQKISLWYNVFSG